MYKSSFLFNQPVFAIRPPPLHALACFSMLEQHSNPRGTRTGCFKAHNNIKKDIII